MMENVSNTTETLGNVRETRKLFSGQAQTRQYTDAEKPALFKDRQNLQLGQKWADPNIGEVLLQDNNN